MRIRFPARFTCRVAARHFKQLKHVQLDLKNVSAIDPEDLIEFIETFIENGTSLRKVTLQLPRYGGQKKIIKNLQSNIRFRELSKVITFNFIGYLIW